MDGDEDDFSPLWYLGWSRVVIVQKFSVLLCFFLPCPLVERVVFVGFCLFILSAPVGVLGLSASLAPSLVYMK